MLEGVFDFCSSVVLVNGRFAGGRFDWTPNRSAGDRVCMPRGVERHRLRRMSTSRFVVRQTSWSRDSHCKQTQTAGPARSIDGSTELSVNQSFRRILVVLARQHRATGEGRCTMYASLSDESLPTSYFRLQTPGWCSLFYFFYLNISGKGQKPLTCR